MKNLFSLPTAAAALLFLAIQATTFGQTMPPMVQGHEINRDGQIQRSAVQSLTLTFDQDVGASLEASDLVLVRDGSPLPEGTAALAYDPATNQGVWTFPTLPGAILPDGNYTATLLGLGVQNADRILLDGRSQGLPGSDYVFQFFALQGDADGDRDVDFLDTCAIRDALAGPFDPIFDFDGDGQLTTNDTAIFRGNMLSVLPPEPRIPEINIGTNETRDGTFTVEGEGEPGSLLQIVNGDQTTVIMVNTDGTFSVEVPLNNDAINMISVSAVTSNGVTSATLPITISQDSEPPFLSLVFPEDQFTTLDENTPVSGFVGDMLSGYEELSVTISSDTSGPLPAIIDPGIGANGRFDLAEFPLDPGSNQLVVTATDRLGNSTSTTVTVIRDLPQAEPRLVEVSGNNQTTMRNNQLPEPLIVQAIDSAGNALGNQLITYQVVQGDGVLFADGDLDGEPQTVVVRTDGAGFAAVLFEVGNEAGSRNNWVEVTGQGLSGMVLFRAGATPNAASQINISIGDNQRGEAGTQAMEPLRVWVNDGLNGVPNVSVTFQVKQGGGLVDNLQLTTVTTDSSGHAQVPFTYGLFGGTQTVDANFMGNQDDGVTFTLVSVRRTEDLPTTFKGIVLDNSNLPIGGAIVTLSNGQDVFPPVATGENGIFEVENILPGAAKLRVDGNAATTLNREAIDQPRYPDLQYNVSVVANADNRLPVPVWLPALNPVNKVTFDGSSDVVLTVEGIEGVEFRVAAGSVTLEDGSKPSAANPITLSIDQVHIDNLPMALPDGVASLFAWTFQPPNMHIDPPVAVTLPNMNFLAPGARANLLSFNHQTERFEVVANTRVSEDGSVVDTFPGEGITISGWGGACPPYTTDEPVEDDGNDDGPDDDDPETNDDEDTDECNDNACEEDPEDDCTGGLDPITWGTGELTLDISDLHIPGRGFDFDWRRSYRSQYNYNGPIGQNWEHSYNMRINVPDETDADQNVRIMSGLARIDTYRFDAATGSFSSPRGFFNGLSRNTDRSFTLRNRDGMRTVFDARGRMTAKIDRNGNTMQFQYDGQDRLALIIDTLGRRIDVLYKANNRIDRIRDFTGREVVYNYDGCGNLISVRSPVVTGTTIGNDFPFGKLTQYEYMTGYTDGRLQQLNHNLISITDPKNQTFVFNQYNTDPNSFEFDRVVMQRWGTDEQVASIHYEELNPTLPGDPNTPKIRTTVIDRNGNEVVYTCNDAARVLEKRVKTNRNINSRDPVEFVTSWTYNDDGLKLSTTYPEGNQLLRVWDTSNPDRNQQLNLLEVTKTPGPRGGDQTQLKTTYTYEPIYNQRLSETDPRGNDPTYVPQNGGFQSAARYTKTCTFDYQEGDNLQALAEEMELPASEVQTLLTAAGISLNLGDLNGDGVTDAIAGNLIRCQHPTVTLIDGSPQEIIDDYIYNSLGQKTAHIDPEGNVDQYQYHPESDPDGDGTATVPVSGLSTNTGGYLAAVIYDAVTHPRRTNAIPPVAIRNEMYYDPVGNTVRTVDGRGNDTLYEVNQLNQIVRRTSEAPFRYESFYFFDANDNLDRTEVENRDSNGPDLDEFVTTTYEYDLLNYRTAMHQEVSTNETLTTRYGYDGNQNLQSTTLPEGNIEFVVFDERDFPHQVTRGFETQEASTISMTYDGNGNLFELQDAEDNTGDGVNESTFITYDGFDRRASVLDAVGNRVRYSFDPADNLVDEQRFGLDGGPSRANNDEAGNVLLSRTDTLYDELSRIFQVDEHLFANTRPVGPDGSASPGDGKVTTVTLHDRATRQIAIIDDNEHTSLMNYDGVDRLVGIKDALGNTVESVYDANHNRIRSIETDISPEGIVPDETFTTQFLYDELDRLTTTFDNLGNTAAFAHDSRDNTILITDPLGNITRSTFDGLNRSLSTIQELRVGGVGTGAIDTSNPHNPDGLITVTRRFDGNSRLQAITDDNGNRTCYTWDALNRKIRDTYADDQVVAYRYDRDSNIRYLTDQNGSISTLSYDGINRLVQKDVTRAPSVLGFTRQTFQYDGLSRRTLATDNNDPDQPVDDSTVAFEYDSLSRLLAEVQNGETVASRYDGVGRRLTCTYPDGRVVEQAHDAINRIKSIRDQGAPVSIAEYDYLGTFRILERRYVNGTKRTHHDGAGNQTGYDGIRREISRRHLDGAGNLLAGFAYAYDKANNRRFERDLLPAGTADVYQYDSIYRLTRAGYDASVASIARVTNNDTTNADATGLGAADQNWSLDGLGNWAERVDSGTATVYTASAMNEYESIGGTPIMHDENGNLTSDGDLTLYHDHLNRLVRIERNGNLIATYIYDAAGRRISKSLPSGDKIHYFYDIANCIEERDSVGMTLRQYIHGIGMDEVLELKTGTNRFYYHRNSIGSIKALTDFTGSVAERYRYSAYGETTILDPAGAQLALSPVRNPFNFTGRRFDSESGLYYYRYRYYDPGRGRFLARDFLGYVDGMNTYNYCKNAPINRVDPWGLESCHVHFPEYPVKWNGMTVPQSISDGHSGFLGYDDQGRTKYYEYGRYPVTNMDGGHTLPKKEAHRQTV